jgi:uncharacterized tellurite resistance protein B-like protein
MTTTQDDPRRIAFLKALITAAWADGKLSSGEIATLSHYLQQLNVTDEEYEQLRPLLENALDPAEAEALLAETLEALASPEAQRTLLAAVEDLLVSDDKLAPEETAFLQKLRQLTHNPPTPAVFAARLRSIWGSAPAQRTPLQRRNDAVDRFFRRRLLEHFRGQILLARARAGLPDTSVSDRDLYRIIIWAGLLSRVAHADKSFCPAEKEQLLQILAIPGGPPRPDVEVVIATFADESMADIDLRALVREFKELASPEDHELLLECLFLMAAADGKLMESEMTTIQQIAASAGFSEAAYLGAFNRCKQRMTDGWN